MNDKLNPNSANESGCTALMNAVRPGNAAKFKELLDAGENLHAVDNDGITVLHYVARHGDAEIMKILLSAIVDVRIGRNGYTPLMTASDDNKPYIVKVLLATGANSNAKQGKDSALSLAKRRGHSEVVRILEEAGARQ